MKCRFLCKRHDYATSGYLCYSSNFIIKNQKRVLHIEMYQTITPRFSGLNSTSILPNTLISSTLPPNLIQRQTRLLITHLPHTPHPFPSRHPKLPKHPSRMKRRDGSNPKNNHRPLKDHKRSLLISQMPAKPIPQLRNPVHTSYKDENGRCKQTPLKQCEYPLCAKT